MKTDITAAAIRSCTQLDELAEMTLALQERLNATKDWLSDAKRKAAEGRGYAPRDVFLSAEKELRDLGVLISTVNERRGALRRLAHIENQAKARKQVKTAEGPKELLDAALLLLFDLYNDSYEDRFVEMLHEADCDREAPCDCPKAKSFDRLMSAGGWAARATMQNAEEGCDACDRGDSQLDHADGCPRRG